MQIPDQADDRLRDIFEPLFALAAAAERGITLHVDAMMKAARVQSGIRSEDDTHEGALVAALTALEVICEPNRPGIGEKRGNSLYVQDKRIAAHESRSIERG